MKRRLLYIFCSWIAWILTFALGKVGFMLYNRAENPFSFHDVTDVLRHGLSMDMSTAGYLVAVPWLVCLVALVRERPWLRRVLVAYLCLAALLVAIIICDDCFLYEFWKFKLNATVFAYMGDLQGTTNSVSVGYLLSRIAIALVAALLIAWTQLEVLRLLTTPPSLHPKHSTLHSPLSTLCHTLIYLLAGGLIFLVIRGGVSTAVQNVGTAYYSQNLFLNHSAVNPVFSLLSSIKRTEDFSKQFRFMTEEECAEIVKRVTGTEPVLSLSKGLDPDFGSTDPVPAPQLLTTDRPDILLVLMEGFGGKFVEALGGLPEVAPRINALVDEGIFFDQYYSNSFRTDRGTVSLLSGWVSYPTTSLMRLPDKMQRLPGLAASLARAGYSTHYLYGGDINFSGTKGYLVANGFTEFVTDKDFSLADATSSKWGVCDGITADRAAGVIGTGRLDTKSGSTDPVPATPKFLVYQTLSSHEPFEVPYDRLADAKLNAFAYTDDCVGRLVETLKQSPVWDNLLVILVPDHGFLYDLTYEDPEYYHCPMLWLGGAVREPRRVSILMNQSDVCATLLAQLGLPHDDYPWSRDVLSPDYRYPFVYSTSPSTAMFRDSTGVTVYDIESRTPITERPNPSDERLKKIKALLQYTYQQLSFHSLE